MTEWIKREHSKTEIDRYGEVLRDWWNSKDGEIEEAEFNRGLNVVQNWRSSHALPLFTFRMGLTQRARRIERTALIAQRMKRLSSVLNKLGREPSMKLSQMQDLGGCRAIVSSVAAAQQIAALYRDPANDAEGLSKCYDYIKTPKEDGYRGIHVVGRYRPRLDKYAAWNGQRIEIQIRSQLQHAFATAVETVTTFTRSRLKFGGGQPRWRRFFSLMGSAIAIREGTAIVPGTPLRVDNLVGELRESARELKVRQRLRGWTDALRTLPKKGVGKSSWLMLVLDVSGKTVKVTGFSDRKKAASAVEEIEREGNTEIDAVLVWVNSINELRKAYPNYYADTAAFLHALDFSLARGKLHRLANEERPPLIV